MASQEDIAALRDYINEPDDTNGWTDEKLGAIIDGEATLNAAAGKVWILKAGQFSTLVDVAESGSSRKLSDLMKNAQAMGGYYNGLDPDPTPEVGGPIVIQRIRRGFA
jgi:hypothetical protein